MKRTKDDSDISNTLTPLKRLKVSNELSESRKMKEVSESSTETRSKKGFNFLTSCQQVLTDEFYNFKTRLVISSLPECLSTNKCNKHKTDLQPFQVLPYEIQAFKIDLSSKFLCEVLEVFRSIVKYNKYPSMELIIDLIQMIFIVKDESKVFTSQYIISRCQIAFKLFFTIHPPCSPAIRLFYKEFLESSLNTLSNSNIYENLYDSRHGIFKNIINILHYEIQNDIEGVTRKTTNDSVGPNIQNTNSIDDLKSFESFHKFERIYRLMVVLEIIVDLLEQDLVIWLSKHYHNPRKYIANTQKPLIAWLLWQSSILQIGLVNDICRQIFQIMVELVGLKYPSSHIKIIVRLINVMFQIFSLCENCSNKYYPEIRKNCTTLSNEFVNIIKNQNFELILFIIIHVKPKELQYLLSSSVLKVVLKSKEMNFIFLVQTIFKNHLWELFDNTADGHDVKMLHSHAPSFVKKISHYGLDHLYLDLINKFGNEYDDLYLNCNVTDIKDLKQVQFLDLFYLSFKYFLLTFNIQKIQSCYNSLCIREQNKQSCRDGSCSTSTTNSELEVEEGTDNILKYSANTTLKPLPLNEECYKEYRLIFTTLKKISQLYAEIEQHHPMVYNIFQNIDVLHL